MTPIRFEEGARQIVAWHDAEPARRRVDDRVDGIMSVLAERFSA